MSCVVLDADESHARNEDLHKIAMRIKYKLQCNITLHNITYHLRVHSHRLHVKSSYRLFSSVMSSR